MEPAGWAFMILSLVVVVGLVTFCYWRVLSKPEVANHMHAPMDANIDPGDREHY